MKIGVISDIHSNIIALKACTEYMEGASCDEYLFLGDYVSDTPYTRETLDYLYEFIAKHTCYFLRGNREEYMLTQRMAIANNVESKKWIWNSAAGNLLFAYNQLEERDFDFIESLPITFRYEKEGYPAITCCHGSPISARELVQIQGDNTKQWLDKIDTEYMICAHTHRPGELCYNGKHYYNTGSVGIAIGDYGLAQCIILEDCVINGRIEWKPQFLKIPYDNKQVVQDMYTSGLLEKAPWFINSNIQILLTGVDKSAPLVELASKLVEEAGATDVWPLIDEKYFEEAASELGIPDYREIVKK